MHHDGIMHEPHGTVNRNTKKEISVAGFSMTKHACRAQEKKTPATRSTTGSVGGNSNLQKHRKANQKCRGDASPIPTRLGESIEHADLVERPRSGLAVPSPSDLPLALHCNSGTPKKKLCIKGYIVRDRHRLDGPG